jgi:hypothetical protein
MVNLLTYLEGGDLGMCKVIKVTCLTIFLLWLLLIIQTFCDHKIEFNIFMS